MESASDIGANSPRIYSHVALSIYGFCEINRNTFYSVTEGFCSRICIQIRRGVFATRKEMLNLWCYELRKELEIFSSLHWIRKPLFCKVFPWLLCTFVEAVFRYFNRQATCLRQVTRGSSDASARRSRARNSTCSRRYSRRRATRTSSCAKRSRSKSISPSHASRSVQFLSEISREGLSFQLDQLKKNVRVLYTSTQPKIWQTLGFCGALWPLYLQVSLHAYHLQSQIRLRTQVIGRKHGTKVKRKMASFFVWRRRGMYGVLKLGMREQPLVGSSIFFLLWRGMWRKEQEKRENMCLLVLKNIPGDRTSDVSNCSFLVNFFIVSQISSHIRTVFASSDSLVLA